MSKKHALLSPSAAHRWLNCTASPRLEARAQDKASSFAEEGTLAHAFCARRLKSWLGQPTKDEDREIEQFKEYHTGEMDEYTAAYAEYIIEKFLHARQSTPDALLLVEQRLDFSQYIPGAFGTGDAIIIGDDTLEVIDFKYGKGVRVDAKENPQMMIYALGAYDAFSLDYNIQSIRLAIVQPRMDNVSEWSLSIADLLEWAEDTLRPKAAEAYVGGVQNAGDWCKFCKVKHTCRAITDTCTEAIKTDPRLISHQELATKVLPLVPVIKTWLSGVEDYALGVAMSGETLDGFKVVEGRSIRKVTDPERLLSTLKEQGYQEADLLKPTELRTITELERIVGKKRLAELADGCISKPPGKPTLVPENDKRRAFNIEILDY